MQLPPWAAVSGGTVPQSRKHGTWGQRQSLTKLCNSRTQHSTLPWELMNKWLGKGRMEKTRQGGECGPDSEKNLTFGDWKWLHLAGASWSGEGEEGKSWEIKRRNTDTDQIWKETASEISESIWVTLTKRPQIRWLINNKNLFLTVMETRKLADFGFWTASWFTDSSLLWKGARESFVVICKDIHEGSACLTLSISQRPHLKQHYIHYIGDLVLMWIWQGKGGWDGTWPSVAR